MNRKSTIQTVIEQKGYDGIVGVIDKSTNKMYVILDHEDVFRIHDFDTVVWVRNDMDILKVERKDIVHFVVDNFKGNRRLVNVICEMMKMKACLSIGQKISLKAANVAISLN